MTENGRQALQRAIRSAARKASRNPAPGRMRYLDAQSERIYDALADDGQSVHGIGRWLWREALQHLLSYRKSSAARAAAGEARTEADRRAA